MIEELIKRGLEAARAGEAEKARGYFVKAVQTDCYSNLKSELFKFE